MAELEESVPRIMCQALTDQLKRIDEVDEEIKKLEIEPAFNQTQVQPVIGVDFAHGVRTLRRQDPDIIMVGEIRDRDGMTPLRVLGAMKVAPVM